MNETFRTENLSSTCKFLIQTTLPSSTVNMLRKSNKGKKKRKIGRILFLIYHLGLNRMHEWNLNAFGKENETTKMPRVLITDKLSEKINKLNDNIQVRIHKISFILTPTYKISFLTCGKKSQSEKEY